MNKDEKIDKRKRKVYRANFRILSIPNLVCESIMLNTYNFYELHKRYQRNQICLKTFTRAKKLNIYISITNAYILIIYKYTPFYKQYFYKQHQAEVGQKLSKSWTFDNVQIKKSGCCNDIIWFIAIKTKMIMKNIINRPWSRHGHKYAKYSMSL